MHGLFRRSLPGLLSAAAGLLIGYLLLNPPLPPPAPQTLQFVVPLLRPIDAFATQHGAWYLTAALLGFVAYLPNTLLIACVTVLLLPRLSAPRCFFYAALLAPLSFYLPFWLKLRLMQANAQRLGMASDIASLPLDPLVAPQSLLILLNFALFSLSVLLVTRITRRIAGEPQP